MQETSQLRATVRWTGLIAGPVLALTCLALLPDEYRGAAGDVQPFTAAGRATVAVMVWMAVWWLTEAIDISATALLPLVLFPPLGIADMQATAAPYAHRLIFLFMGGFLLALSMERWGLGRRIALLTLRCCGTQPANMVGGFMVTTAVLSAFVSNTATTAMMLPIALSVIELLRADGPRRTVHPPTSPAAVQDGDHFGLCLLLGIAYAASIGGVATIIGTPPNVFLVSFVEDKIALPYRTEIGFAQWLRIGVPLVAVFLPITWLLLTRVIYPIRIRRIEGGQQLIENAFKSLGPVNRGEWATLVVFLCTVSMWLTRPWLTKYPPFQALTDSGIAMTGALVLFVIPVDLRQRTFAMDWKTAGKLPWGILVLFGGGLTLAAAAQTNQVAEFIGSQAGWFAGVPVVVLVLVVSLAVIFLTELTSNTATTATLIPVFAALAPGLGIHPFLLIVPAAICASCAFMLPVATPPNAIIFGSGQVSIPQMAKAGLILNLIGVVLVTVLTFAIIAPLLGIDAAAFGVAE